MDNVERGPAIESTSIAAPEPVRAPVAVAPSMVYRSLQVGSAHDSAEIQADRMADAVVRAMRSSGPTIIPSEGRVSRSATAPSVHATSTSREIRRSAMIGAEGGTVDADTSRRIQFARGRGTPLEPGTAERFGNAFGADFGDVRIHRNREASALSERISARAFTVGSDVFYGKGAPGPGSGAGDHLLAHELTHVVQQTGGARRAVIRRDFIGADATEDAKLFDKVSPADASIPLGDKSDAQKFGITGTNFPHYLERHTFKYQRLNAKTIDPAAGMFPRDTDVNDVKNMLVEALGLLPDTSVIGTSAVSQSVDLKNGLRVNLGALKGGKLSAFFPVPGGTNAGYHKYEAEDLKQIRDAKNEAIAAEAAAKKKAADEAAAKKKASGAQQSGGAKSTTNNPRGGKRR